MAPPLKRTNSVFTSISRDVERRPFALFTQLLTLVEDNNDIAVDVTPQDNPKRACCELAISWVETPTAPFTADLVGVAVLVVGVCTRSAREEYHLSGDDST